MHKYLLPITQKYQISHDSRLVGINYFLSVHTAIMGILV